MMFDCQVSAKFAPRTFQYMNERGFLLLWHTEIGRHGYGSVFNVGYSLISLLTEVNLSFVDACATASGSPVRVPSSCRRH